MFSPLTCVEQPNVYVVRACMGRSYHVQVAGESKKPSNCGVCVTFSPTGWRRKKRMLMTATGHTDRIVPEEGGDKEELHLRNIIPFPLTTQPKPCRR